MPAITVDPELYRRVEDAAAQQQTAIGEIFANAVRRYLWELERQKVSQETAAYRAQHTELVARYRDQYIAFHDGKVVDSDADFSLLRRRVREQLGRVPVMFTWVDDTPETTLVRHSVQTESVGS